MCVYMHIYGYILELIFKSSYSKALISVYIYLHRHTDRYTHYPLFKLAKKSAAVDIKVQIFYII